MRSFDEIKIDVERALGVGDSAQLQTLADELGALGDKRSLALAEHALGGVKSFMGPHNEALEHGQRALTLYEELGDREGAARVTMNIGIAHRNMGNFPAALEHYRSSQAAFEEQGDTNRAVRAMHNIAAVMVDTGSFVEALEMFQRVLVMNEEMGDLFGTASTVGWIGQVHFHSGSYPEALEHQERAMVIWEEIERPTGVIQCQVRIGDILSKMGSYDEALQQFDRALRSIEETGYTHGLAIAESSIGQALFHQGSFAEAVEHFERARNLHEELVEPAGIVSALASLGAAYVALERYTDLQRIIDELDQMELSDPATRVDRLVMEGWLQAHEEDHDRARTLCEAALKEAQRHGLREKEASVHTALRDMAQQRNDLAEYIEHNNALTGINEEIRGSEARLKVAMREKENEIRAEREARERERTLLYGALPRSVADRKLSGEDVSGDHFEQVSVLFLDIVNFTTLSDRIPPGHVVHLLEQIFSALDDVCAEYGLTKIKTIGDSYMAAAGVPEPLANHAQQTATCALAMMHAIKTLEVTMPPELGDTSWVNDVGELDVRIGIHCGPVTAGVIGKQRLQYDVWGDTVNVASRMESTGEAGRIQVSSPFAEQLRLLRSVAEDEGTANSNSSQQLRERGAIEIKGKGTMTTYWLEGVIS